ncbi:MAG TPA: preprotein translocase subunit SecA, partial [Pyrinomonadaceae bacterium]|nr:preprotein translocase subunit SecA [Pyrinomonadaceae bacterium]
MGVDKLLTKVFGSSNQRYLKSIQPIVDQINALEPAIKKLSDEQLRARTAEFKEQLQRAVEGVTDKEDRKRREREALDEILPEAFAIVREGSVRTTGMRHFDVQLIGGIVLHQGRIAEMRTGEGKTLVATLPSYLNALTGRGGVHVITVNDYLASRDAEWMGQIHRFLGLEVGCIQNDMDDFERQTAYASDITYGTNNEFGFDYLRDNMKFDLATCVQRGHYFAVVDEVDSILIDEARTPLIISGPSDEATDKYYKADAIIPQLRKGEEIDGKKTGDYVVDERQHTAVLTEEGVDKAERLLAVGNLYDPSNMELLHCVEQALKAHTLYRLDHQYVVQEGEVIIVDDFTGRLMKGRRWSDGLHQAVEAKEGVKIEKENQTLATITLQNYFRLYEKLSGMTGTAETEAAEFQSTYKLDVMVIPTHMPMVRSDFSDMIYRTLPEKWDAVVEEIKDCYDRGQPTLVGTVSVENSELIARKLQREAVPHNVLNAKYHEREAEIVAQAGRKGAVTIATNMAGRGTDILLGGNPDFMAREFLKIDEIDPDEATEEQWAEAFARARRIVEEEHKEVVGIGGLHILGTERHESRRIDNQLRGRAGRQGDPGSSRFFLSLEDDLMRIFAGDKVKALMQRLGMEKGVAIESKMVSKRIESAQKSVEGRNFESRKHLLEYDDVMNKQRETIYGLRRQLMEEPDQRDYLMGDPPSAGVAYDLLSDLTKQYLNPNASPDDWDIENYKIQIKTIYDLDVDGERLDLPNMTSDEVVETVWEKLKVKYSGKEQQIGAEAMRTYERIIMLNIIDAQWKDHLLSLDHLKQGIGLVGYGQKDPLVEYKKQSFDMFQEMLDR